MKKLIATIALAGLGAGLAVGAQAQTTGTVTGNPASLYSVNITAVVKDSSNTVVSTPPSKGSGSPYTYSYTATIASNSTGGSIDTFTIGGIQGFLPVPGPSATGSGGFDTINVSTSGTGLTSIQYISSGASGDFITAGQSATFSYKSSLPPFGTVGITPSQNAVGGGPGIGSKFIGPGVQPIVPETSSFALLGLGLLPLGMLARRRMANRA